MYKTLNEKEAVELLRKYSPDKKTFEIIYLHSKAVQEVALKVAERAVCDREFIKTAALLHDIGRCICPPGKNGIRHGVEGAEILKKEKLPRSYQRVCETHLGVGITKEDIINQKLPLPKKDFVPKTKEEIIIAYADNLADGSEIKDEKFIVERFKKELSKEYGKRVEEFHKKVHEIIKRK